MKNKAWRGLLPWVCALLVLALAVCALSNLERGQQREQQQQLEDALHRAAAACYAAQGFYPPDLEYLRQHYGIHYDEQRFTVFYEVFAANLMPDITVLDNTP